MTYRDDDKIGTPHQDGENDAAIIKVYIENFRKTGITALARMSKREQMTVLGWAWDVVEAYSAYLNNGPMTVNDATTLPHSKEHIKIAIKTLLPAYVANESNEVINQLKNRYVRLSEFQMIGNEDIDLLHKEANEIKKRSKSTDPSLFPTYHRYMQLIVSEQKILIDEVESLASGYLT